MGQNQSLDIPHPQSPGRGCFIRGQPWTLEVGSSLGNGGERELDQADDSSCQVAQAPRRHRATAGRCSWRQHPREKSDWFWTGETVGLLKGQGY